jgi:hypothetical protein
MNNNRCRLPHPGQFVAAAALLTVAAMAFVRPTPAQVDTVSVVIDGHSVVMERARARQLLLDYAAALGQPAPPTTPCGTFDEQAADDAFDGWYRDNGGDWSGKHRGWRAAMKAVKGWIDRTEVTQ